VLFKYNSLVYLYPFGIRRSNNLYFFLLVIKAFVIFFAYCSKSFKFIDVFNGKYGSLQGRVTSTYLFYLPRLFLFLICNFSSEFIIHFYTSLFVFLYYKLPFFISYPSILNISAFFNIIPSYFAPNAIILSFCMVIKSTGLSYPSIIPITSICSPILLVCTIQQRFRSYTISKILSPSAPECTLTPACILASRYIRACIHPIYILGCPLCIPANGLPNISIIYNFLTPPNPFSILNMPFQFLPAPPH